MAHLIYSAISSLDGYYTQLLEQIRSLSAQQAEKPLVTELIIWRYAHYRSHSRQIRAFHAESSHERAV